jgi:hypothetical protein
MTRDAPVSTSAGSDQQDDVEREQEREEPQQAGQSRTKQRHLLPPKTTRNAGTPQRPANRHVLPSPRDRSRIAGSQRSSRCRQARGPVEAAGEAHPRSLEDQRAYTWRWAGSSCSDPGRSLDPRSGCEHVGIPVELPAMAGGSRRGLTDWRPRYSFAAESETRS